ncbi:MAG: aldolase/citrate lyase family protein [Chloroflexi bacterium]|nr:aldolase/citrate lyase family protein [Chloroflexota bacterium]
MRPNRLRGVLAQGKAVFGTMLQELRSPAVPIILANAGLDFIFVDMEHGAYNMETIADLIKVIRLTGVCPLVRVPNDEYPWIARALDAGAEGVMVPRVETRDQVERIVRYAKYPPVGERGCSVVKGHNDYRTADQLEFTRHANQENLIIIQIERQRAVENIDDLLSVPGVDAAVIGPNDLALSYGVPEDLSNPLLADACQKVVDASRRHGCFSGMHVGDVQTLKFWMAKGMRVIVYWTDIGMLAAASVKGLAELRQSGQQL